MKLNKPYTNAQYADLAVYCNRNGLIIEDKGDYLEAVKPPEPTVDELKANVRAVRNRYLEQTDKYLSISDFPITEEERESYKQYRTYLRDYTLEDEWWLANPKTFEEWSVKMDSVQDELPHIVEEQTIETEAETEQP